MMSLDPHIFGEAVAGFEKKAMGYQPKPATHDAYGFAKNLPTMRRDPQTGQQVPIQLPAPRESTIGNLTEMSGVPEVGRAIGEVATTAAKHPTGFLEQWLEPPRLAAQPGYGQSPYLNALKRTWNGTPGTEAGDDKLVNAGRNALTVAEVAGTAAMVPGGWKATSSLLRSAVTPRTGFAAMRGGMGAAARATAGAKTPGLAGVLSRGAGIGGAIGKKLIGGTGKLIGGTAKRLTDAVGTGTGLGLVGYGGLSLEASRWKAQQEQATAAARAQAEANLAKSPGSGFPSMQTLGMLGLGGMGAYGLYHLLASRKKKKRQQAARIDNPV